MKQNNNKIEKGFKILSLLGGFILSFFIAATLYGKMSSTRGLLPLALLLSIFGLVLVCIIIIYKVIKCKGRTNIFYFSFGIMLSLLISFPLTLLHLHSATYRIPMNELLWDIILAFTCLLFTMEFAIKGSVDSNKNMWRFFTLLSIVTIIYISFLASPLLVYMAILISPVVSVAIGFITLVPLTYAIILVISGYAEKHIGSAKKDIKAHATREPGEVGNYCPKCGTKISPDDKFCKGCGSKVG